MGPKQPSTVTQTNKIELSPEQKELYGLMMPKAREYASSTPQLYGGSGIVGFNETEKQGQQGALDAAGASSGLASRASATQAQLLDPEFMLKPNEYVKGAANAVTSDVTRNLMENIMPGIRSGAISSGGQYSGGSTREGIAQGKAIQGTSKEISDALAKMYFQNYQTGLQGMQGAVNNNQNIMNQSLFPSAVMQAVGGQQRGMEQALLDEEIQKFYTQQDLPLLQAQQIAGLAQGIPAAGGTSTVTPATPKVPAWQQGLGLALTLAGGNMGSSLGMNMMGK